MSAKYGSGLKNWKPGKRVRPDTPARRALPAASAVLFGVLSVAIIGCDSNSDGFRARMATAGIAPIQAPSEDPDKVALGRALFFDKILSGNMDISCATCHHPLFSTSDGLSLPFGTGGVGLGPDRTAVLDDDGNPIFIPRNAPDAFNRGDFHTMFWDARVFEAEDGTLVTPAGDKLLPGLDSVLAAQAMFPVTSRHEMRGEPGESALGDLADSDLHGIWTALMDRLLAIPEYVDLFEAAFPEIEDEVLTFAHAANAIAAFEIQHWTLPDSPFDRFLAGDDGALTPEQRAGADLFFGKAACVNCHSGPMLTDEDFHNTGVPQLGPGKGHGPAGKGDFGLEGVTGDPADRYRFRTPPLRNVAMTGPWMHDGAFTSLRTVVERYNDIEESARRYDREQLTEILQDEYRPDETLKTLATLDPLLPDIDLDADEIDHLLAFLESLTAPGVFSLVENDVPASVPSGLPVAD